MVNALAAATSAQMRIKRARGNATAVDAAADLLLAIFVE